MTMIDQRTAPWAALYALPLTVGAAQFWATRKGFYFTGAGADARGADIAGRWVIRRRFILDWSNRRVEDKLGQHRRPDTPLLSDRSGHGADRAARSI